MNTYTAREFAALFVEVARRETSRRSYHSVREGEFAFRVQSSGKGNVPYDTGRLQNSIYLASFSRSTATVKVIAPYASYLQYCVNVGRSDVPNQHRGWLQKFATSEYFRTVNRRYQGARLE